MRDIRRPPLRFLLLLIALAFPSLASTTEVRADADLLVLSALRLTYHQDLRLKIPRDRFGGPVAPALPRGMSALMNQRFGTQRAKQMAQGFSMPSGVVLRPMFWIPRSPGGEMRGAMFALGGKF